MNNKTKLVAFHGEDSIKAKYLKRLEEHRLADQIVKGQYWEEGKGCAVGCTLHSSNHAAYETELGIPQVLARLEDSIFEGLPNAEALEWPGKFLSAIQPGADLSLVWPRFAHWLLVDPKDGVIRFASGEGIEAIKNVAILFDRLINGEKVSQSEWLNAASSAGWSAARSAARAAMAAWSARSSAANAAWSAARSAARAAMAAENAAMAAANAAWSAEGAAERAAWSAANAADSAEGAAESLQAKKLIELLEEAK
jgi:hypothetical protein